MARRLRDRPTGDLLVLIIAGTICTIVLGAGLGTVILVVFRPDEPVIAKVVGALSAVINTLIGLLAGYIAGVSGGPDLKTAPPSPEEQGPDVT
jgi:hypothetical protein